MASRFVPFQAGFNPAWILAENLIIESGFSFLVVRGLTELTREEEVPVLGVEWPLMFVGHRSEVIWQGRSRHCSRHVHVTPVRLEMIWEISITVTKLDSMTEFDSGSRCRIRIALLRNHH